MNIVLGLTEDDIDALDDIQTIINLYYDNDDFPEEMTEKDCERYENWINMSSVINKICYVIENQMEIEKTDAGRTHVSDCQSKRCNDKDAFLREKLITLLEEVGVPRNLLIGTRQNYAAVTDGETMTADNKCSWTDDSFEKHLSSIKNQEINDRNNIYHSEKSSG